MGEVLEHRLVIARVAHKHPAVQLLRQIAPQQLAHDPFGALPFVEVPKAAVDVDAAHRGLHAFALQQSQHLLHGLGRVPVELGVVKGQVGLAPGAVAA